MARPSGTAGAGTPERKGDAAEVGEKPRRIHPVAANIEVAIIAMGRAAVHRPALAERSVRRCPELVHIIIVAVTALGGELRCGAEANAQLGRQRSRTHSPLLPSAVDERGRLGAL